MGSVSDDFNRANESPLASPWTAVTGGGALNLFSNAAHSSQSGGIDEFRVYGSSGIGADQFAQATIASISGGAVAGVLVRFQTAAKAGYRFYATTGGCQIDRLPGSVNIGSAGAGVSAGDVLRLEVQGTTLRGYVNGVLRCTGTDSTYASASNPGLYASGTVAGDPALDNFSAGDLGGSAAIAGTGAAGMSGDDVRAGGKTLVITLTGDTFVTLDNTKKQAIIDGIVAGSSTTWAWNAVRPSIPTSAVVATSSTVVTVTLPALSGFQIDANQTLTITVPASALTGGNAIVASPTITLSKTSTNLTPVNAYVMSGTATRT
jgi:hypothetical protein